MIRADLGLLDQRLGVRDLVEIERLVQTVIGVEPADMRRREGDVAFGIALGELGLVEPVDGAAGDELDLGAGLGRELLGDGLRRSGPSSCRPSCETISFSAAEAGTAHRAAASAADATRIRFMFELPLDDRPESKQVARHRDTQTLRRSDRRVVHVSQLSPEPSWHRHFLRFRHRSARHARGSSRCAADLPVRGYLGDDVDLHQVFGFREALRR